MILIFAVLTQIGAVGGLIFLGLLAYSYLDEWRRERRVERRRRPY